MNDYRMQNILRYIMSILLCFALHTTLHAATTEAMVGKVVWVKGKLQAMSLDMTGRSLAGGSPIYLHDTLITDSQSEAQIVFTDNTLMTFRTGTNFYIDRYDYHPATVKNNSVGTYAMNLIAGGFRTITGLIAKKNPSQYQVKTPVAIIGVRGTDYNAYIINGRLLVGYNSGSPSVTHGGHTLYLNAQTPYASVRASDFAPVPLKTQPVELKHQATIQRTTFDAVQTPPSAAGAPPAAPPPPGGDDGSSGGTAASGGDSTQSSTASGGDTPVPPDTSSSAEGPAIGGEAPSSAPAVDGTTSPSTMSGQQTPANSANALDSFCIQ